MGNAQIKRVYEEHPILQDTKRLTFYHRPLQISKLKAWAIEYPTFLNALKPKNNISKKFYDEMYDRIYGSIDSHVVIVFYGETGSFKSSVAQELALIVQPDFKADQIVFENEDLLDTIKDSKPQQVFIRDESLFDHGVGSLRLKHELQIISETLRKRQNSLFFLAPTIREVGSAHFYLMPVDHTEDHEYVRVAVQDPVTRNYLGHIIVPIHLNSKLWKSYSLKKTDFLEKIKNRERSGLDIEKKAKELLKDLDLEKYSKKKERKLYVKKKCANLTGQEVEMVHLQLEMYLKVKND